MSRVIEFTANSDPRGHLLALNSGIEIPFEIRRVFYIYGNASGLARAGHAHVATTELLISVHGSCVARIEDKAGQRCVSLDRPERGLLLHPMTWLDLTDFSRDCVLLVLADTGYLPNQALTDLDEFRRRLT